MFCIVCQIISPITEIYIVHIFYHTVEMIIAVR